MRYELCQLRWVLTIEGLETNLVTPPPAAGRTRWFAVTDRIRS
jgi:hypothetical protein